jgi:hypothetical protein
MSGEGSFGTNIHIYVVSYTWAPSLSIYIYGSLSVRFRTATQVV